MLNCPLLKYSPVSLDRVWPAFPPVLEQIAAFVSRAVLGLRLRAV